MRRRRRDRLTSPQSVEGFDGAAEMSSSGSTGEERRPKMLVAADAPLSLRSLAASDGDWTYPRGIVANVRQSGRTTRPASIFAGVLRLLPLTGNRSLGRTERRRPHKK